MFKTDIAFKTDINKSFLPFITAFMVFLASITFATGLIGNSITRNWNQHLSNNITIQILPDVKNKNPQKEIETRISNITNILKYTPGIKSYNVMSLEETNKLIQPLLGDLKNMQFDIPLPRLISIEISDVIPLNYKTLKEEIQSLTKLIKFETYDSWIAETTKTISAIQTILSLILILILTTTALTISYTTKTGLNINKKVINIMHMVGATNKYITTNFSRQMSHLALLGGIIGYIISVITLLIIQHFSYNLNEGILANIEFNKLIYLYIAFIPLSACIITKISAIITIKKELNKLI